ncbi:S8 family serine peptidase [Desulfocastanea catecholica]
MKRLQSYLIYGILVLFLAPVFSMAGNITPDLEELLANVDPDEEIAVIVTLADQVDLKKIKDKDKALLRSKIIKALKDKAEKTQKPVKDFLQQNKIKKITLFWVFNGLAVTVPAGIIEQLAGMDGIEMISLDTVLSMSAPVADSVILPKWNVEAINAPQMWSLGHTGAGTVLANMDTGVDGNHPDLSARWRGGSNSWYDPNGEHSTPYDRTGHGTQVMGIMVGGSAGGSTIGVASGAQWIAVKIFNDVGQASYSVIHSGFQWLMDPDDNPTTNDAPDVVNNSWGYNQLVNSCFGEFLLDIQALKAAQIGVVFSGGNSGPYDASSESPANYSESIATGAVGQTLVVSNFSARGPSTCDGGIYPEVMAPGESIYTADKGGYYTSVQGTSFAAPHVTGAMGLLLSADPSRSIGDVESALKESAQDLGVLGPDNDNGHGLLDVMAAYNWLSANQPQCIDNDGDGFCADAVDQSILDCNDTLASVYPGAPEINRDGVDQDCNGFDLTIEIILAGYSVNEQILTVEATSSLGRDAGLQLDGYGAMQWDRKKSKWQISVGGVAQDPGTVTVLGLEGEESAATSVVSGGSTGGGKGKKK